MKIAFIFLALFHFVIPVQENEPSEYNIYSASLCTGDQFSFGNKSMKFKEVVSDSRCPKNVTCVWAGEVKVLVEFFENGVYKGDKIISNSGISIAEFFEAEKLDIMGFSVSPYPVTARKIKPEEYTVNIKVSERLETD
ncbi:MAG: hypothetical protein WB492_02335 [Christiangramia sp.]